MFDFPYSLHNVYRNFIPVVDSKHKSSDCVGNTILSHFLVTFLFLQSLIQPGNDAHAWKDRQTWSSAWSESGTRSRSFVIAAHCRVNYSPGSPPSIGPQWNRRGFKWAGRLGRDLSHGFTIHLYKKKILEPYFDW